MRFGKPCRPRCPTRISTPRPPSRSTGTVGAQHAAPARPASMSGRRPPDDLALDPREARRLRYGSRFGACGRSVLRPYGAGVRCTEVGSSSGAVGEHDHRGRDRGGDGSAPTGQHWRGLRHGHCFRQEATWIGVDPNVSEPAVSDRRGPSFGTLSLLALTGVLPASACTTIPQKVRDTDIAPIAALPSESPVPTLEPTAPALMLTTPTPSPVAARSPTAAPRQTPVCPISDGFDDLIDIGLSATGEPVVGR
jgi:hypothetical protein